MPLLSKPLPLSETDGHLKVARAMKEHKIGLVPDIECVLTILVAEVALTYAGSNSFFESFR